MVEGRQISDADALAFARLRGKRKRHRKAILAGQAPLPLADRPTKRAPVMTSRPDPVPVLMDRYRSKPGAPWVYAVGDPEACERRLRAAGYRDARASPEPSWTEWAGPPEDSDLSAERVE